MGNQAGEEPLIACRRADDAVTALATERAQRRRLEQELLELCSQARRPPQATAPDIRLSGEAVSAIRVVRRLLVGRTAEALRHRATEIHALEAGVRTEAYRRASVVRRYACAEDARSTLLTAGISEAPATNLGEAVQQALLAVEEGPTRCLDLGWTTTDVPTPQEPPKVTPTELPCRRPRPPT
eukprot:GHVU01073740.1.p1 GENE.GHVU01073740.1~~GHVU01073740.1.p1  ORF type:complete len:195 (-),score=11.59 GHVU01073740.1:180-728(-)